MSENNGEQNREPRHRGQTISSVDRAAQALELRRKNKDYRTIAAMLGYGGPGPAHKAVSRALKDTIREPAEEVRMAEIDRLDAIASRLWPLVDMDPPDLKAVDRYLKVMERRAALLGLDAPKGMLLGNLDDKPFKVYAGFSPDEV